jgi:predicted ferric reductase
MLAKKYKSELVSISNFIEGIYTLEFRSLGRPYIYRPGQFLHLAIDSSYDGIGQWPDSRCFSMQSNPDNKNILLTYAVKGDFTSKMERELRVGFELWLKLPYGDLFDRNHNQENNVFISGGTGITPFLSLFSHISFNEYINPRIYLGFRSKEYNLYQAELSNSFVTDKMLNVIYQDQDGILDINRIFSENGTTSIYFISGPPIMINSFRKVLLENNVPEANIITDDWS